jgi:hypothetical protein
MKKEKIISLLPLLVLTTAALGSEGVLFVDNYLYLKAATSSPQGCQFVRIQPKEGVNLRNYGVQAIFVDPVTNRNEVIALETFKDNAPITIYFNNAGGSSTAAHYRIYILRPMPYNTGTFYGPHGRPASIVRRALVLPAESAIDYSYLSMPSTCSFPLEKPDNSIILNEVAAMGRS